MLNLWKQLDSFLFFKQDLENQQKSTLRSKSCNSKTMTTNKTKRNDKTKKNDTDKAAWT